MSRMSKTITVTGPKNSASEHAERVAGGVLILTMIGCGVAGGVYQRLHGMEWIAAVIYGLMLGLLGVFPGVLLGAIVAVPAWIYFRLFGDVQIRAEQITEDEPQVPRPVSSFVVVRRLDREYFHQ